MTTIEILEQNPSVNKTFLMHRINMILADPSLKGMRILVSYSTWGGLKYIAKSIESFLAKGGSLETIYGVANNVTTPDALLYTELLKEKYSNYKYSGAIEDLYLNSTFHKKLFIFDFDGHSKIICGSSNLTGGGLLQNQELCIELTVDHQNPTYNSIDDIWNSSKADASLCDVKLIRKLHKKNILGSETDKSSQQNPNKKYLKIQRPAASNKPLFKHILSSKISLKKKHALLSNSETITERPSKLYLQVLRETGGGHQVQLPTATLASFFGVGLGESKKVTFEFPKKAKVTVNVTHFENHTHRIRLLPLKNLPRPLIVLFKKTNKNNYKCTIYPKNKKLYNSILKRKCTEQTRKNSKKWGLEI